MEGSITIDKQPGKPWMVTVRLPIEFLKQFTADLGAKVGPYDLCSTWGGADIRNGTYTPFRSISAVCTGKAQAKEYAHAYCEALLAARAILADAYHQEYPIALTPESATDEDIAMGYRTFPAPQYPSKEDEA